MTAGTAFPCHPDEHHDTAFAYPTLPKGARMRSFTRITSTLLVALIWTVTSFSFGLTFDTVISQYEGTSDPVLSSTTVDVSIVNFDFTPAIISIQAGDTVRWTNDAAVTPHTSTDGGPFDATPGLIWDSGLMTPGSTYSTVFDSQGEFDYFCALHPLLMFGEVIVGGTGLQVAMVPDDISSGALASLDVEVSVFNFTGLDQSGDLWFTVVLPNSAEIDIPASFLSLPSNPISGQVLAQDRLDLLATISVPGAAPAGHYEIKVKIGSHPSGVVHEDSFEFDVPVL